MRPLYVCGKHYLNVVIPKLWLQCDARMCIQVFTGVEILDKGPLMEGLGKYRARISMRTHVHTCTHTHALVFLPL